MNKLKEITEKKTYKIIMTILKVLCYAVLVLFIIIVYLQRFSNNKVSFFNYRMFTVVSESMAPKYSIGDVLIAKEVKPSTIKKGDDISYEGKYGDTRGKIVTHQVIDIDKDEDGKYLFHAKGLKNLIQDPIIFEEQLYGIIVHKSAILSFIYGIVSTSIGFYLCIIIPLFVIVGSELFASLMEKEERKQQKLKA